MIVKMKPICDCGYEFKKLACVPIKDENDKITGCTFYPNICPNCYEIIETIQLSVPDKDGNFSYTDTVDTVASEEVDENE